ncbi:hypothetical protein ABLB95_15430 (plasmid) [Acinetobacter radioresistens]|uniref:hypothetical protein n=1 Tax=Acinetobacter radioresistens TaxID=40216 RepID=UPI0032B32D74
MAEDLKTSVENFNTDAQTAEEVVNGNESGEVTARLGRKYPTLPAAIEKIMKAGGYFDSYATLAEANAKVAEIPLNRLVRVLSATDGGDYYKASADATSLTKSAFDPVEQAKADATTKANAAEANAKTYADTNKLDLSKIITEYVDGNKIGPKTPRYTNLGLSAGTILAQSTFDSLALTVNEGDVLFILNDKGVTAANAGARIAFFAEDPNLNRSQTAITHTATVVSTPTVHWKVTVPAGAKYLMMNTRTVSGGVTYNLTWAVHKDAYNASFTTGKETITKIQDMPVGASNDFAKAVQYTDQQIAAIEREELKTSSKNLFKGDVRTSLRLSGNGTSSNNSIDNVISNFIPVEFGKTYTVSGLNKDYINGVYRRINGYGANTDASFVKSLTFTGTEDGFTFTVDDAAVKYVLFPISSVTYGTYDVAVSQPIQFEVGDKSTAYEPYKAPLSVLKTSQALQREVVKGISKTKPVYINQFTELNKVRDDMSKVGIIAKNLAPTGISNIMQGSLADENVSNVMYTQYTAPDRGAKGIYVNLMKYVNGTPTLGVLNSTAFNIPSGMLDNGGVATEHVKTYPKYDYCHPSIAYDSVGIGGFKYWMITSILPGGVTEDATWEDEDLFVSNDAKNWQRVRSMYESDKAYTTATLRLPPQAIHTATERKHGFLPCPSLGDTFEMSMPAYGGMPAVDRQMITMNDRTPFKHDPCLIIDGGYVYTYHTFHMPYSERTGGKNKFLVCVRTSDGINWDVVRTDGSTMRLTEETSRQIFTKDEQGRYNYLTYVYDRGFENPEVIKWGDGDYELFWGGNFSLKFAGTTPYTFNFSNEIPVQDKGFGNHPGLLRDGNDLYAVGSVGFYKSTDRGTTFTKFAHYPFWLGGVLGIPYKKALCKGEGGKIIVADVERYFMPFVSIPSGAQVSSINRVNLLSLYEYSSLAALVTRANEGLVDAYLDFQLCKINYQTGMREFIALQSVSLKTLTTNVNNPLSRFKLCDMNFDAGDNLHIYVTLNSRCGAKIEFGGIDIS